MVSMEELLNLMVQRGGSDLHLSVGSPPRIRLEAALMLAITITTLATMSRNRAPLSCPDSAVMRDLPKAAGEGRGPPNINEDRRWAVTS